MTSEPTKPATDGTRSARVELEGLSLRAKLGRVEVSTTPVSEENRRSGGLEHPPADAP